MPWKYTKGWCLGGILKVALEVGSILKVGCLGDILKVGCLGDILKGGCLGVYYRSLHSLPLVTDLSSG